MEDEFSRDCRFLDASSTREERDIKERSNVLWFRLHLLKPDLALGRLLGPQPFEGPFGDRVV